MWHCLVVYEASTQECLLGMLSSLWRHWHALESTWQLQYPLQCNPSWGRTHSCLAKLDFMLLGTLWDRGAVCYSMRLL